MKSPTVLVIEDNELNMKLVRSLLRLKAYEVLEAESGEAGIEMARRHRPRLILMDIQLPGMDGLEATRILKKDPALQDIPVIALTSYAMRGDEEKAREAGCEGYISKPIDTRGFLSTLEGFLEKDPGPPPSAEGRPEQRHRWTILIVDDDPLNIKLLKNMLGDREYEIREATNGEEAVKAALNLSPDLILMDIMMPLLDGFEATRRIKNNPRTARIPIIQITALDSPEDKIKGLESGADEFLNRPVNIHELTARIRSLLRLKKYQEQLKARDQLRSHFSGASGTRIPEGQDRRQPVVLLVEDNERDALIIRHHLEGCPFKLLTERDGEAVLKMVHREKIDLILLDVLLPGMDGYEVCRRLKEMGQTRDIQVVLITCLQDLDSKIRGVELGADDYLIKPVNGRELKARINILLKKKEYQDQLGRIFEQALDAASTDGLTGLFNQTYFKRYLELEMKRAQRQRYSLTLILIDIDDFKKFNDTYGHQAGDLLLQGLSQAVKMNVRDVDLAARYGGDEFALILPYTDREGALPIARRIQEAAAGLLPFSGGDLVADRITLSLGLAFFPGDASTAEELLRHADLALYQAKAEGKGRLQVFQQD